MVSVDKVKLQPKANKAIIKSWIFNLLAQMEISEVEQASRNEHGNEVTIIIRLRKEK